MRRLTMIALGLVAACTASSPDLGGDALLQLPGTQWRPGPLPEAAGGPDVVVFQSLRPSVVVPTVNEPMHGAAAEGATAVAILLDGDPGGWLLPAGTPTVDLPTSPSFDVRVAFEAGIEPGPIELLAVAFDRDGRPGTAAHLPLIAEPVAPPTGELVIGLVWTGPVDLDLHVIDPLGGEAWSGDPNTWEPPPPGQPVDPNAWKTGGLLDHDGNAGCHRDGHPAEHVVWSMPPPPGDYVVRVDTRDLCGGAATAWAVTVYRGDQVLAAARGTSLPDDVLLSHGAGSGVLATRFSIPPP